MDRNKVKKILSHLKKARDLLDGMSEKNKEDILELHHTNYTLQYCLRWGVSAAEEILDKYPRRGKK